jgi:hypothetical protein
MFCAASERGSRLRRIRGRESHAKGEELGWPAYHNQWIEPGPHGEEYFMTAANG